MDGKVRSDISKLTNDELLEEIERLQNTLDKKDQVLNTLFSNLGHEMRTPLNGIMGFSEVLKMEGYSKQEMEYYTDIIVESSEMLVSIVKDAMDISKIESGRFLTFPESFDLNDIIYDVFAKYKDSAEEKGLQLFVGNMISEEFIITSSPDALSRILSKLIDNAIKFTKKGWIKISYQEIGDEIEFCIEDTGIGIAKSIQSNLFTRFTHIEVSNSRKVSGTGLDLTLCNGLVKLLGGKIEYFPKREGGSFFKFSICRNLK